MQRNYEPNADRIISLYQQMEEDILSAIVRRMLKMGYVSDATKHQIEVLQAAGLLYDDIIQLIADRTDASTAQVKALFEDAGVQTVAIDNDIYEAAGEIPVDIRQDDSMKQVLEAGYKKTLGTMQNLVRTTANNAQTAFIQMCDRIYLQVASGAFSYQEAIRNALRALADTGAYITYPTGHTDRLDVAVRRCVLTGVSQTAAAVAKQQAENADCKYMELTAHSGARPEHAKWQGQLVIIKGKRTKLYIDGLKVFTLSEIGYGDGAGFKGWNCRHNWHPYYVGYSTPNYTQEELKKLDEPCIPYNGKLYTEYEISQMQRAGERKVRAWKRRCITAQEGVNSAKDDVTKAAAQAEYSKSAVHLKANEEKLKDFCKQTGQDRDRFREQVYWFGRSEAQRAVQAAKKATHSLKGDYSIKFEKASGTKEITPQLAKEFSDEYDKFEKKFGKLTSVRSVSIEPYKNNNIWGSYNDNSGVISIYGAGGKDGKNTISQIAAEMKKSGKWSTSSPYHAFRHELGHALQNQLKKEDRNYGDKLKKISAIRNSIFELLTDADENAIMELKKQKLSVYGLCDDNELDEFIAECVAEYCSKKPRKTARDVVEILLNGVETNAG